MEIPYCMNGRTRTQLTEGVHTTENAKRIFDRLKAMETTLKDQLEQGLITPDQAQKTMKQELQSAGQDVFSRY